MPKNPTKKQVGYLLSDYSPLTTTQKNKLKREIHGKTLRSSKKKKG